MLKTIKDALGCPVEIEFAVDLNPGKNRLPSFYLLQIKPLVSHQQGTDLDIQQAKKSDMILYTESSLGNGKIDNLHDIIYINPEKFDKLNTMEMVKEMEYMNEIMRKQGKQYILIGPGRWGTSDRFLGIPVSWRHISNARVIVETSLANFPLDSSLGSHFFHNVTSMNIGYLSVQDSSRKDFIHWDQLNRHQAVHETRFFRHIRYTKPLTVLMNGRKKTAAIIDNSLRNE